jgi:hypothetical protein
MTFKEAWTQWGEDILLARPEYFTQQERAWFFQGMGNLCRDQWHDGVRPPLGDFGVLILPQEPGFATPLPAPPEEKPKKQKKRYGSSPATLPRGRYFGPPQEWEALDHDYSLHMDPQRYGIPEEDLLWWEVDEPWEPDRDISGREVSEARKLASFWSRTSREDL